VHTFLWPKRTLAHWHRGSICVCHPGDGAAATAVDINDALPRCTLDIMRQGNVLIISDALGPLQTLDGKQYVCLLLVQ
jgi:hypothetical protein